MKKIASAVLGTALLLSNTAFAADVDKTYGTFCQACHATGAANAPKLGDKAAWAPRIAKGMDALMKSAQNGVPGTAMMAKGTCMSCTDADLKAAVEYMVNNSK